MENEIELYKVNGSTIYKDGVTICTAEAVKDVLNNIYGAWTFSGYAEDGETPLQTFQRVWEAWKSRNIENFYRMHLAFTEEYDPIENYDRKEEGGWTDATNSTRTGSSEGTNTSSGTNTGKVSAFNSSSFQDASQDISSGTDSTEGTSLEEAEGSTVHTMNGYRVHGNIGVLTSSEAIDREFTYVRSKDLTKMIVSQFVGMYCYMDDRED